MNNIIISKVISILRRPSSIATVSAVVLSAVAYYVYYATSTRKQVRPLYSSNYTQSQEKVPEKVQAPKVKINFEDVELHITKEAIDGVPEAFMLHHVLTDGECEQFLVMIEKIGGHKGEGEEGGNAKNSKGFGVSDCKFWKAPVEVMQPIWSRVGKFMPDSLEDDGKVWTLVKDNPLNEKFRYYCYDAGYVREKHFDGAFLRNNANSVNRRDQSHFTLLIYLNDGFDGGETTFFPGGFNSLHRKDGDTPTHKEIRVNPKMGSALVFRHTGPNQPLHEGSVHNTTSIRKCLLRSDVMYAH